MQYSLSEGQLIREPLYTVTTRFFQHKYLDVETPRLLFTICFENVKRILPFPYIEGKISSRSTLFFVALQEFHVT